MQRKYRYKRVVATDALNESHLKTTQAANELRLRHLPNHEGRRALISRHEVNPYRNEDGRSMTVHEMNRSHAASPRGFHLISSKYRHAAHPPSRATSGQHAPFTLTEGPIHPAGDLLLVAHREYRLRDYRASRDGGARLVIHSLQWNRETAATGAVISRCGVHGSEAHRVITGVSYL